MGEEAEIEQFDWGVKQEGVRRVNLQVQYSNWETACTMQAKYRLSAAYALDASRGRTETGVPVGAAPRRAWRTRRLSYAQADRACDTTARCWVAGW